MIALTLDTVKTVLVCPGCSLPTDYSTEHLWNEELRIGKPWGPWYCAACGVGFTGKVLNEQGRTEIKLLTDRRQVKIWVLLKHNPGEYARGVLDRACSPIYIVLDTSVVLCGNETLEEAAVGLEYFYSQHTCPTNWMRGEVVKIRYMGDSDPHGVFEYWAAVLKTEELEDPFEAFADILKKDEGYGLG